MRVETTNDIETKILFLESFEDASCVISTLSDGVHEKLERLRFNIKRNNKKRIDEIILEVNLIIKLISDLGYSSIATGMIADLEEVLNDNKKRTLI